MTTSQCSFYSSTVQGSNGIKFDEVRRVAVMTICRHRQLHSGLSLIYELHENSGRHHANARN